MTILREVYIFVTTAREKRCKFGGGGGEVGGEKVELLSESTWKGEGESALPLANDGLKGKVGVGGKFLVAPIPQKKDLFLPSEKKERPCLSRYD